MIVTNNYPVSTTPKLPFSSKTVDLSIGLAALLSVIVTCYVLFASYFPWASSVGRFFQFILFLLGAFAVPVIILIFLTVHYYLSKESRHKSPALATV